jgi:hypothetical protein
LKEARVAADTARGHLRNGIDPGQLRKIQKSVRLGAARMVYEAEAHLGREPLDQSAVDAREESLSVARIPADFRNPS